MVLLIPGKAGEPGGYRKYKDIPLNYGINQIISLSSLNVVKIEWAWASLIFEAWVGGIWTICMIWLGDQQQTYTYVAPS